MSRLGFAGVGWLGQSLIRDLASCPALRLAAVQDINADLAAEVAARYGCGWHGQDFNDLLARDDVDAVVISTPNGLHAEQARQALRRGKHVLVQKPLALSRAEAESVITCAEQNQRLLFVDYSYRFLDTMEALRAHVRRPRRLRAAFHNVYGPGQDKAWFFRPELSGGGALTDLGVHLLDLAVWLVRPQSVRLHAAHSDQLPIDYATRLDVRLDDIPAEIAVSWNAPRALTEIAVEIDDEDGLVRWENVDGSFFRFRTLIDGAVVLERETTLRADTWRAFAAALVTGQAPAIDARVYGLLDQVYGRR